MLIDGFAAARVTTEAQLPIRDLIRISSEAPEASEPMGGGAPSEGLLSRKSIRALEVDYKWTKVAGR